MTGKYIQSLAVLAVGALLAVAPASASASPELQTEAGTKVKAGSNLKLTNSVATVFTTGSGNITCSFGEITASLIENTGKSIAETIETISLSGTEIKGRCGSTFAMATQWDFTPQNLHWCLTSTSLPNWVMGGGGCGGEAKVLAFVLHAYTSTGTDTGIGCKYERNVTTGTYNTMKNPLLFTFSNTDAWTSKSGGICPGVLDIDAQFKERVVPGEIELKIN